MRNDAVERAIELINANEIKTVINNVKRLKMLIDQSQFNALRCRLRITNLFSGPVKREIKICNRKFFFHA